MKIRVMAVAGLVASVLSIPAQAQSGCVKEVFNKYCLGGDIQPLLNRYTPVRTSSAKDGAAQYVFADGSEQTTVTAVNGKVETVARRQHPGVQATFDQMERDLIRIYGEPRQRDKGSNMRSLWDQGAWRVILTHTPGRGEVALLYRHETLQAARKSQSGYSSSGNPKGY
jgi:hypothetical protein